MASSLDNFSDLEDEYDENSVDETLIVEFTKAADHVPKIAANLDSATLLKIYGLYKQANVGSCNIPKPSWFKPQDKAKWEAWSSLKDMPKEIAMRKYIQLISETDKTWVVENKSSSDCKKDKTQSWVAVSTLNSTDHSKTETEKNIFDYCKEGDSNQISVLLKESKKDLLDESGLGLLHWAADRGFREILKILLSNDYNINLKDSEGQTALHYAVSCGHNECVKFLLDNNIDRNILDVDGLAAVELTDDVDIKQLFV